MHTANVLHRLAGGRRGVGAQGAGVGPLPGVCALVDADVAGLGGSVRTEGAVVGLGAGVLALVHAHLGEQQRQGECKRLRIHV